MRADTLASVASSLQVMLHQSLAPARSSALTGAAISGLGHGDRVGLGGGAVGGGHINLHGVAVGGPGGCGAVVDLHIVDGDLDGRSGVGRYSGDGVGGGGGGGGIAEKLS